MGASAWQNMPGWSKGLLAQLLTWAAFNLIFPAQHSPFQTHVGPLAPVWLQGLSAGLVCLLLGLPRWWFPISLLFLPAVALAQSMPIPPWAYLAAFVLMLIFFSSIFQRGAPLYLSGPQAWETVLAQLPRDRAFRFIDIGSGLGGLSLYLASQCPNGEFHGVESAPGPWLISRLRNWFGNGRVRFRRNDYRRLDLGEYDVVFAFLSPLVMQDVVAQARAQMRSGSLFLSLAFPLPGLTPDLALKTDGEQGHMLYGWRA